MAAIDTLTLRNALVRGRIADEEPAEDLTRVFEEEIAELRSQFVTVERLASAEERFLTAIEGLKREFAEHRSYINNRIFVATGLIIGAIGVATAVVGVLIAVLD